MIIQRFHNALYLWTVYEGNDIMDAMKAPGRDARRCANGRRRPDPGQRRGRDRRTDADDLVRDIDRPTPKAHTFKRPRRLRE